MDILGPTTGVLIGAVIATFGVTITTYIAKQIVEKIKGKHAVLKWFLIAEKVLPGKTGDEKFAFVKGKILQYMPDAYDKMTDAGLQEFYNEIKPELDKERVLQESEQKQ